MAKKRPLPGFLRELREKDETRFRLACRRGGRKSAKLRKARRTKDAFAELERILADRNEERLTAELVSLFKDRNDDFYSEEENID